MPRRTGVAPPACQVWLPVLTTLTGKVWTWFEPQLRGMALRSYPAVHTAGTNRTPLDCHWSNQNCCSLTISASSSSDPAVAGADGLTVTATVCPAATSAGRLNRWSLTHAVRPDRM